MITNLTPKQKKLIAVYRDRYTKIGLNTDRINEEECIKDMNDLYTKVLDRKKPDKIIICKSPLMAWKAVCLYTSLTFIPQSKINSEIYSKIYLEIYSKINLEIHSKINSEIYSKINLEIYSKINSKINSEIDSKIDSKIDSEINSKIYSEIYSKIYLEIYSKIDSEIKYNKYSFNYIYSCLSGSFDCYWFGYLDYYLEVLKLNVNSKWYEKYEIYKRELKYGYIYPLEKICFVSEKPMEINRLNKKLHADYKPALKYEDGFCLWCLNGIKVPEWIVMTKPENMDAKEILQEKNIEVRREAIKKMGNTLFFEQLNANVLDHDFIYVDSNNRVNKEGIGEKIDYELLEIDVGLSKKIKVLKMKNPSVEGIYHYECVLYNCKTIEDCFEFRTGQRCWPEYLS